MLTCQHSSASTHRCVACSLSSSRSSLWLPALAYGRTTARSHRMVLSEPSLRLGSHIHAAGSGTRGCSQHAS